MTQLEPNKPGKRRDYLSSYVEREGCWIHTGSINNRGYGTILGRAAHRYFYEHMVGLIDDDLTIDHLCRVTACVNPMQLGAGDARREHRPERAAAWSLPSWPRHTRKKLPSTGARQSGLPVQSMRRTARGPPAPTR